MAALIVTGLKAEADLFSSHEWARHIPIICGAGDEQKLKQHLRKLLLSHRPDLLISFGIAGGLAADLNSGTLILADSIFTKQRSIACDVQWHSSAKILLPHAIIGPMYGSTRMISDTAEKAQLASTGALAVDMESLTIAHLAEEFNVGFGVLRVVADPLWRTLPPAARLPVKPDGRPDLPKIIGNIFAHPKQIGAMLALKSDYDRAMRHLAQVLRQQALFV